MGVSVVVTVLNEENTIFSLIDSLRRQLHKFDELIIVDGGSTEKTVEVIKHFQKKDGRIKLLITKASRGEGRNIGIDAANEKIIALTDAGCVAEKEWLSNLVGPFKNEEVDVVAGFYNMIGSRGKRTDFERALSVFLGTNPRDFDAKFLPSARSMAFRKRVWEETGGFSEKAKGTAEDTLFSYKLTKENFTIVRVKNARVGWRIPSDPAGAFEKMKNYAKGDVETGIWIHPAKGLTSHNIKSVFKFFRYAFGLWLFVLGFKLVPSWQILGILLILYIFWSFRKVYLYFEDWKVGLWGIYLQFLSDIAVMYGFLLGVLGK